MDHQSDVDHFTIPDPALVTKALMNWAFKAMEQPEILLQAQLEIAQRYTDLWQAAVSGKLGPEGESVVEPKRGDRRFRDERWNGDIGFNFLKQAYLLTAGWLQSTVRRIEGLDQ